MNGKQAKLIRKNAALVVRNLPEQAAYQSVKNLTTKTMAVSTPPVCEPGDLVCQGELAAFRPTVRQVWPNEPLTENEMEVEVPTFTRVLDNCRRWKVKLTKRQLRRGDISIIDIKMFNEAVDGFRAATS